MTRKISVAASTQRTANQSESHECFRELTANLAILARVGDCNHCCKILLCVGSQEKSFGKMAFVARLRFVGAARQLSQLQHISKGINVSCVSDGNAYNSKWMSSSPSEAASEKNKFLHLPLGAVPQGTDPADVRDKWHSDAMDLIQQVPPIEVQGTLVACDGGGGASGHPIEYIKLDMPYPAVCKYCGLRYISKH